MGGEKRRGGSKPERRAISRWFAGVPTLAGILIVATLNNASPSLAQPATPPGIDTVAAPASTGKTDEAVTAVTPSIQPLLGSYGDPGGYRAFLAARGFTYDLTYIGDAFGNPVGGYRQGATYEGRLDVNLNADLQKLLGLQGLTGHAELFQVHGQGLTVGNTLDLFGVTGIETTPGAKLYEAWLEQSLLGGRVTVRGGQLAADTEFVISQTAAVFIGASYGWPASFGNDLPSGGPVYPLGAAGVRLKAAVTDHLTVLVGGFDGDPNGTYRPGVLDTLLPRLTVPSGFSFRTGDPPFAIGEAQYSYNQGVDPGGLPGVAKLGYFHHFDRFDATNRPFAPGATYRGDDGVYGIIDQTVYREAANPHQGAAVFLRATYDPADRNLIDFYVDGGVAYNGLLPSRPNDTAGLDFAYGHISRAVTRSDIVTGAAPLIRDFQTTFEATYQIALAPGITLQPDAQYIVHPGAHGVGLPVTGRPTHDTAVIGLRATVHY